MLLNSGNDRENYLRAVPGYPSFIDLIQVLKEGNDLSVQDFWEFLYHQKAPLTITLVEDNPLNHQLYHLFFEQQNQKKLKQNAPIHIGFPILIWYEAGDLRSAPLFLLKLEIHPKFDQPNQWSMQVTHGNTLFSNPLLNFAASIPPFWEKPDFELPDAQKLAQLATIFEAEHDGDDEWQEYPGLKDLFNTDHYKLLKSSMVLGLFPEPEQYRNYPNTELDLPQPIANWRHQLTIPKLDPNQRAVHDQLQDKALSVVTGGPGTGKKHLTEALLINALSNHKKILLISGKPTNIPTFQKYLDRHHLGHLSFWLREMDQDLDLLLALLCHPVKTDHLFSNEQKLKDWVKKSDEIQQFKQRYDAAFRSVKKKIFGTFDWSQTVGIYLKARNNAGKAILSSELSQKDFEFHLEEYKELAHSIQKAQNLFQGVKSIRHPLRALHPSIFLSLSEEEALNFVTKQLHFFLDQLTNLQQDFIQVTNNYKQKLTDYFENYYQQQSRQIQDLTLSIANNITAYGKDFELSSKASLKFIGVFSNRVKKIAEERNSILEDYHTLLRSVKSMPELNFVPPPATQQISIRQINHSLATYKDLLDNWIQSTPSLIEQHLKRLNFQNATPQVGLQSQILDLEAKLDQIVEELNHSNLLAEKKTQPMLTLPKRQHKTEQLMEFLEHLHINLSHFSPFYQWQHSWLQQEANAQALIKAIIRAKPDHWVIAFDNWYLQQLLTRNQSANLPQQDFVDYDILKKQETLQNELAIQINSVWEIDRQDLARYFRKQQKQISDQGDLRNFFAEEGKSVFLSIPTFFSTPEQAVKCFQNIDYPIFDLIIFESAQFIDEQMGRYLQRLGKQQVVIGNDQFIQNDEKEDYLEYLLKQGIKTTELKNIHKYYPANLFQLANGSLITENAIDHFTVESIALAGQYNEALGINSAEVHYIIQFLHQLERSPQRTYPKIAIVCNTTKQRNYISKAILKIKQDGSFEEKENCLQMERNGLMVLHLSELEASRFDLLLYTFTYGPEKSSQNVFTKHADVLNTAAGVRQVNELMSTASETIRIIHSIPEHMIDKWAESEKDHGYFLIANYLKMVHALKTGQSTVQKQITKTIQNAYPQASEQLLQQPLYEEIAGALKRQLPNGIIHQNYQRAHLKVPLLIQNSRETDLQLAIIVDYFLVDGKASDLDWELKQRKILKKAGIQILTTYSIDWWKNPFHASQQLVDKIKLLWAEGK